MFWTDRDISKIRKVLNSAYHEKQAVEVSRKSLTFSFSSLKGTVTVIRVHSVQNVIVPQVIFVESALDTVYKTEYYTSTHLQNSLFLKTFWGHFTDFAVRNLFTIHLIFLYSRQGVFCGKMI